eukprot:8319947-Pyramimonas_sp.AAC.1
MALQHIAKLDMLVRAISSSLLEPICRAGSESSRRGGCALLALMVVAPPSARSWKNHDAVAVVVDAASCRRAAIHRAAHRRARHQSKTRWPLTANQVRRRGSPRKTGDF